MFDPYDATQIRRLNKAVRASYRKLDSFRRQRRDLVREYAGPYYGDNANYTEDQPVNMLALTVEIYLMLLAGSNPKVLLPTTRLDLLPDIADLEAIVNKELADMRFDKTLRRWVQEAMFCCGVLKCGLVDSGYVELVPGEPLPGQDYFAEVVDFDDFVFDTDANSWERITFLGDRYKVDYEALIRSGEYDVQAKAAVKPFNSDVSRDDGDRASTISITQTSENQQEESFRTQAEVWDIALPEEGIIVTIPDAPEVLAPLKVVEWSGASNSPYHVLRFHDVPGNAMPLPPGALLKSLNKTLNGLYRKMVRQAQRQKTLGLYRAGEADEADKIRKANDGDLVGVSNPDTVTEISFGGASQENMAFALQVRQAYGEIAGNIDALGGLGPQADTARQDAMLTSTVSRKAAKMSLVVVDATVEVIRTLIHHVINDPLKSYSAMRPIAGTGVEMLAEMTPGDRAFSLGDFGVEIQPYSMQYRSPGERAADIRQLLAEVVFPMLPVLQGQGVDLKLQSLFELLGKYMDLPELVNLFEFAAPVMQSPDEAGGAPQVSHRTYERVSRPGASAQGNARTMMQLLSGGNPQQSEQAAITRPTGT